jgi:hypothetical protein
MSDAHEAFNVGMLAGIASREFDEYPDSPSNPYATDFQNFLYRLAYNLGTRGERYKFDDDYRRVEL